MALVTIRRSSSVQTPRKTDEATKSSESPEDDVGSCVSKSLNECYFANKGAALVLGGCEWRRAPAPAHVPPHAPQPQPDIQHHLQSMFYLLRPEETLKMAVKLESAHAGRRRYLVVVCHGDEAALLGIDCNERTTVGLVLRVLADTSIKLDGDGGFSVCVCNQQHIFKPVSVQAMWSALQTLHRTSGRARALNHFAGGATHGWCAHYEGRIDSDRSCLNEWHAMDCIESRRPPSPDSLRLKPRERDETERVIRCTLKEIMMSVDLDEVTSKAIRGRLEDELDMDLAEYKSFIDHEMLTILGQMDAPTEIFEHVYLGSEWNASNLEELQRNGVRHILNVTREIDNFFPGVFDYQNIRVYDDEKTDLLKHWDNTFKYINKARNEGSKVLVHCKMGISRSASVVIAYAMKAYNWNFDRALKHVKAKRSCIKPNNNFLNQLETYQGILDAMKNKEKLQRSKSETNLKSPKCVSKIESKAPLVPALRGGRARRPRSWSPDARLAAELLPPTSVSLEHLALETRHKLMPYGGGSYSVSPNQIIRLKQQRAPSVRLIVREIETAASGDRRDPRDPRDPARRYQRSNFGNNGECSTDRSSDASLGPIVQATEAPVKPPQVSPLRNLSHKNSHSNCDAEKIHTWDPGEPWRGGEESGTDVIVKSDSGIIDVKTKMSDVFSNLVDRNMDGEALSRVEDDAPPPSRQSSWSSSDSAAVMELARHSSGGSGGSGGSWGSGGSADTRVRPDPGADLGVISEHEPRRAATGDLSANERKFNETCAILKELAGAAARMERARDRGASTWSGRLSASAPADTWLRAGLRRRRLVCASYGDLPRAAAPPPPAPAPPPLGALSAAGLVSNLKKEFEARSETDSLRRSKSRSRASTATAEGRERVPTSPPPPAGEDVSVKVLVDRYDQPGRSRCEVVSEASKGKPAAEAACKAEARGGRGPAALRNSFCGAVRGGADRPPIAPIAPIAPTVVSIAPLDYSNVVVSTVMSKAQNKKQLQHGKTHPLTRLNLNRSNNRCSNPVYNTM